MSCDETAIRVEHISKTYELYPSPGKRLKRLLFGSKTKPKKVFHALHDISFEVKRGECVGVVGRNGAGKSTLLQILVGTLAPTTGHVSLHGRVAALLELGSGFDPQYTGRDNVFLNASILGLTRAETEQRYQEIADFADIGEFMDRPVNTYSSGMRVRLAFAVQIMVKPDILIIDEALAVGDAAFHRKCYARIEELIRQGTTIFLVTHNTGAVRQLCSRVIFLKNGKCMFDGNADDGISAYLQDLFPNEQPANDSPKKAEPPPQVPSIREPSADDGEYVLKKEMEDNGKRHGSRLAYVERAFISGLKKPNLLETPCKLRITAECRWFPEKIAEQARSEGLENELNVGIGFANRNNIMLFGTNTLQSGIRLDPLETDHATVTFEYQLPELHAGTYFVILAVSLGHGKEAVNLDWNSEAITLECRNPHEFGGFISPEVEVKKNA